MNGLGSAIPKIITNVIRIAGITLAVHEGLFVEPPRDAFVFAVAAFMMAGATGFENFIDRFVGSSESKK